MNFDRITPIYDALARLVFGRRLQRAQTVFLNRIPPEASVLIVGGGSGWLLEPLLKGPPQGRPSRIVYLESSAKMLARASRRMVRKALPGSVEFRLGDTATLLTNEYFDVIMTPFVLDLFTETTLRTSLIPQLRDRLRPEGMWLIADFINPSAAWQKVLVWLMIQFFRLTAGIEARHLADWPRLLTEAGLRRMHQQRRVWGMVSSGVWYRSADALTAS